MNISIEVSTCDEHAKMLCKIALYARLFVNGWALNKIMHTILRGGHRGSIVALAWLDETPIGVSISTTNGVLQVFVRKAHRRKGIGSKLVNAVKRDKDIADEGIKGSGAFWDSVGVEYAPYWEDE
jgi:GNAT superfamily N-acetyltransferase